MRWAAEDQLCVVVATFTLAQGPCDAAAGKPPASAVMQNSALYNQTIDAWSMRDWPPGINGHHHFFQTFAEVRRHSAVARRRHAGRDHLARRRRARELP